MKINAFLIALLLSAASGAGAAARPAMVVEGVQMPAWVEHASGARDALAPGAVLNNKDRIITGPGARALLRLADGSLVKLGENGILALDDLGQRKINLKDTVIATLDVLNGAFRFTTQALYKFRGERDVKIQIVTITAGIRGTDVWGKADQARDVVCLIEGNIAVVRGNQAFTMAEPMSFYVAPRNEPGQPVAPLPKEQFARWAAETEISAGAGALRKGGAWRVYLLDANNQDDALKAYDRVRNAGYAAEIRPVTTEGGTNYRLRISHLASKQEAAALAVKLKGQMGITAPVVSR